MTARQFASLRKGDVIRHTKYDGEHVVTAPSIYIRHELKGNEFPFATEPEAWTLVRRVKKPKKRGRK